MRDASGAGAWSAVGDGRPVPSTVDGCIVRRAWPRRDGLVLELVDATGVVVPAQRRAVGPVELGCAGVDPELPGLPTAVVAAGGVAAVAGHRLGRRAVLSDGHRWTKVVRPTAARAIARRHRDVARLLRASPAGVAVAGLEHVDETAGALTFGPLAGRSLLAHDDVIGAAAAAGDALRRWQQLDPPGVLAHHDAGDEIAVLERWVGDAAARGLFDERDRGRLRACVDEAVRALGALPRRPPVLAHRDLHDRQLLVDSDGRVGFLDLDTVALADPALDVGNLIAHIELAAAGGVIEASTMRPTIAALLEGFLGAADATVDATAVGAYRLASRTRLVAVHAFRPTTRRAAAALLHGPASAVRS